VHKDHQDDIHQRWHPPALGIEGIQDDIMDEDDEAKVKSKDHCVIKMKA
jgi:hypothetical protein